MALSVSITENTTTATKKALCGSYSFHATASTLGSGRRDQHEVKWTITSAPAGFSYRTEDPRITELSGTATTLYIDPQTTGVYGWTFAFPCTVAGDYTVRCDITDTTDGSTSFATTTVTVAAAPSTIIYLDGNATGADDGTSWDDAYTDPDTAMSAVDSAGGDVVLYIRGGQTYTPTTLTEITDDNVGIWAEDYTDPPIIDLASTSTWYRWSENENGTVYGLSFIDTVNTDSRRAIVILNGTVDLYTGEVTMGATGNRFRSYIELTTTSLTRVLIHNADCSSDADRYPGAFITGQCDVMGGSFFNTATATERPFRFTESGFGVCRATLNGVNFGGEYKASLRFQSGEFFTVDRCQGNRTDSYSASIISINGDEVADSADVRGVRISRCLLINQQTGNSGAITYDAYDSANDTDNTISVVNCVITQEGASAFARPVYINTGCYAATVTGNTIISENPWGMSIAPTNDIEIEGNIIQHSGSLTSSNNLISVTPGSGTTTVADNVVDKGTITNTDIFDYNGTAMALATFNSQTGVSGNTEETVTIDDDYNASSTATYTASAGLDYFSNTLPASPLVGAVQSVPAAPTVVNLSPADNATGVSDAVTPGMQFSENMAVGTGTIELRQVSGDTVLDSIAAADATINFGDRTEVTLTGLSLSGETGAMYIYIPSGAFVSAATGVAFAGYTTNTDWNFTVGTTGGNRSRIRNGLRQR